MADLLGEVEKTQDAITEELLHLQSLEYVDFDNGEISLSGNARSLFNLADKIYYEIKDADEDTDEAESIFDSLF